MRRPAGSGCGESLFGDGDGDRGGADRSLGTTILAHHPVTPVASLHRKKDDVVQHVPGERFGEYLVQAEIGRGGQAVVYRARHIGTDRDVAVKIFDGLEDERLLVRFQREAVAAARVEHPNIVPIYAAGDVDGVPYIAMRLIRGPSLAEALAREGRLDHRRAIAILGDIAAAVDAAHAAGLVHRDIKPANVLIDDDGRAYLSDFGVARLDDLPGVTRRGDWLGTVEYVAPEQAMGQPATSASDIYSFGVLAFEVITGRPPFVHRQASAVLVAHVQERPPTCASLGIQVPAELDQVFAQALAKVPTERPQTAREIVAQLDDALIEIDGSIFATRVADSRAVRSTRVLGPPNDLNAAATLIGVSDHATLIHPGRDTSLAPRTIAPPKYSRRRRLAVATACALLTLAGAAVGWSIGARTGTGAAHAVVVPNAHPGQYRVVLVRPDGTGAFVGPTYSPGDCLQVNSRGAVRTLSGSLFGPCGLIPT